MDDAKQQHPVYWEIYAKKLHDGALSPQDSDLSGLDLSDQHSKRKRVTGLCITILRRLTGFLRRNPALYRLALLFGAKKLLNQLRTRWRITEWW